MDVLLANHSTYPRVGEGADALRLRRAYAKRETGEVTPEQFEDVARDYVQEVIAEQEDAGLDVVTDGQGYWYDIVSHPTSRLDGLSIGGLLRLFDTNTYVRQPEVTGDLSGSFGLAEDFAKAHTTKQLKVSVAGPYTLARHSVIKTDDDLSKVALVYAEILAREIDALAKAGCTLVQIEEPSLLKHPDDAPMVNNLLKRATELKPSTVTVSLVTYWGDATIIYGELLRMPVDMLGFDLIYGSGLADMLVADSPDRPVALGAIDGRNTKLDDIESTKATVGRIVDGLGAKGVTTVHLQPSSGLEYLPRDRAQRKLHRLAELRDTL